MAASVKSAGRLEKPSTRVMTQAIELAIKGRSPYPGRASFVNHDSPNLAEQIACAFDENMAVVLVWPDLSSRVLKPGDQIPAPAVSAALKESGSGIGRPAA